MVRCVLTAWLCKLDTFTSMETLDDPAAKILHSTVINLGSVVYLNRDHIVLVSIEEAGVVLTTTLGMRLFVPGRPDALAGFMDQLVNACGSNFVAIPAGKS